MRLCTKLPAIRVNDLFIFNLQKTDLMQYFKHFALFMLIILLTGCGISRRVADLHENAETAYKWGNYENALGYYEEVIELKNSHGREIDGKTYYRAGVSAWELHRTGKAIKYLDQARRRDFTNETSYYILALAYRETDNLSLEINNLENYVDSFPDGEKINEMRKRLFETYIESNNLDPAMELWPDLKEMSAEDPELLEGYFTLNRELNNEEKLKDIAEQLYRLDDENTKALKYLGEYYFWVAENRYQKEMAAYEENHTRRQYRKLLDALDEINEQFRISRDYLERLWEISPSPQTAIYLKNIYIRFGNEEKAEYFNKYSVTN